jgi:hypothetical protein
MHHLLFAMCCGAAASFERVSNMNNLVGAYPVDGPGTNSSGNIAVYLGLTDSVGECEALCGNQSDCHSYTWCDAGCRGGYGKTCYKRVDNAWCSAAAAPCKESDHTSGRKIPVANCTDEAECSLNGVCNEGHCDCNPAWRGATCGQLDLLPLQNNSGIYKDPLLRSWGGSLWQDDADSSWTLFANEVKGGCSLYDWDPSSQVVRLTSPSLAAPFVRQGVVLPPFSSNPTVRRAPDGTWLMFYIADHPPPGLPSPPHCNTSWPKQPVAAADRIFMATAASLQGPWAPSASGSPVLAGSRYAGAPASAWDYHRTNPAPVVLPNGTVLLYFRGTPGDVYGERMGLAVAAGYGQPFVPRAEPLISDFNEDPFVFRDRRGHFHALLHGSYCECGAHYSSEDGLRWTRSAGNAYDNRVEWEGGGSTVLVRRERPQLHFAADGRPTHLLTGAVDQGRPSGESYTLLQRLGP